MDKKSIIILVVCFALMLLWYPVVVNKMLYPPKPLPPGQTNIVSTTSAPAAASPDTNRTAATQPPAAPAAPAPPPGWPSDIPEQFIEVTNKIAHYTFTSHGGGLKTVELLEYRETVSRRRSSEATNRYAALNLSSRVPVLSVLGGEAVQGDGVFELERTADGVRTTKTLTNGLRLAKDFAISTNYLVRATVRLENGSGQPLSLPAQEWVTGTATPLSPRDDGTAVGVMWFDGARAQDISAGWFANKTLGCFPGTPRSIYQAGQSNVFWVAPHNQFFALAAMTKTPGSEIVIRKVDMPRPTPAELAADSRVNRQPTGFEAAMVYPAITLAPGQALEREFLLFAGPKEYRTLATIAASAKNSIDEIMGFGGFFGFFSKALLLSMNWIHDALRLSYGWAIIVITIIIKILFWPLTQASTRSMKRMQALQPQMKAIQEKYKDDPVKMNRKVMEFMKEHKVSPLGGCLPMLLQMPVFIGFFYMIRSAIELRGASWFWVADLAQPDTLFLIPGINFPFNLLPLIMGATMLWQAHLTPPSPGMDPMQQKIMKYMPLMFMVFLYNFSAGLTLYWTVQNLLTIAQTKLTKTTTSPATPAPAPVLTPKQKRRK